MSRAGRACVAIAIVSTVAVLLMPAGEAQEPRKRGGPRDWSHGRLVAAGYGSDDPVVRRDWRTLRRHLQIEEARGRRGRVAQILETLGLTSPRAAAKKSGGAAGGVMLDWSLNTGGYGSVIGYPAKYSFDISASNCSDVIYYTVNHTGRNTATEKRPNVIAMTHPYVGCPGNPLNLTPKVKFALALQYGTGTSPTLSLDGKVLYLIESRPQSAGGPILRAINVDNITTNPGSYDYATQTWTSVHTLAPPNPGSPATSEQLFALAVPGVDNNLSSPYYDYEAHRIYFGDSAGNIRRVDNVRSMSAAFLPAIPCYSSGTTAAGAFQSPMVYGNNVVTGSTDGYLYRIDLTQANPTCFAAMRLGGGFAAEGQPGGLTSPTIDVTNSTIIVGTGDTSLYDFKAVAVYRLNFAAGEAPIAWAILGTADGVPAQFPALDNEFWTTNDGHVYAIGNGSQDNTMLIKVPYNGTTMLNPTGYAELRRVTGQARNSVGTSPVVEFLTAASVANPDFLFVGGNGTNYNFMNRISANFGNTATSPAAMNGSFATPTGISSGISVDTRTTATTGTTATANIYFGTAGSQGNNIQSTIVQLAQQF